MSADITSAGGPFAAVIADWQQARRELVELERAEHPDIVDQHGRKWSWISKDLYRHCQLAWPERLIRAPHGLPSVLLADNPNYQLCAVCLPDASVQKEHSGGSAE